MVNAILSAMHSMWTDVCTVYAQRPVTHANGTTTHESVAIIENAPCMLSFKKTTHAIPTATAADFEQVVRLFVDVGLMIPAGSRVVVQRGGRLLEYTHSGEAAVFEFHQEVVLKLGGIV